MTPVVWLRDALDDLDAILRFVGDDDPKGAETIARRVLVAEKTLEIFPRSGRRNQEVGTYEAVVIGVPLLLIYDLIGGEIPERVEIIAVFHTARDPQSKPVRDR